MAGGGGGKTASHPTVKFDVIEPVEIKRVGALVVLQGTEADIGTHVKLELEVVIGRDPIVELPLEDDGISRRHCRVAAEGDQFLLEDLQSTNGTRLNGFPIEGRVRLRPGDRIFLGSTVVKFSLSDDLELNYHAQMDRLIGTDDLTGLIARRRFDAAFARELETAIQQNTPLGVMMLDLDGLKQINDTYGHPSGAHTISVTGRLIGEMVAPHGSACRAGGDEFLAYLRGMDRRAALGIGELVRLWVEKKPFEKDGVLFKPTISVGVAAYPEDGTKAEELFQKADDALYRAKREGGNQVF